MRWHELLAGLDVVERVNDADVEVTFITEDSRRVASGYLLRVPHPVHGSTATTTRRRPSPTARSRSSWNAPCRWRYPRLGS